MRKIGFLLLLIISLSSCTKRIKDYEGTIPREKFVLILKDIHLADGTYNNNKVFIQIKKHHELSLYDTIFLKYGYDREAFVKTINAYSNYPNDFQDVYNKVISKLDQELAHVLKEKDALNEYKRKIRENLWQKKISVDFMSDTILKSNYLNFSIPNLKPGTYLLEARVFIPKDENSKKPGIKTYLSYKIEEDEHIAKSQFVSYKKKNDTLYYSLKVECSEKDSLFTHLKGSFGYGIDKEAWNRKLTIHDIFITYKPAKKDN